MRMCKKLYSHLIAYTILGFLPCASSQAVMALRFSGAAIASHHRLSQSWLQSYLKSKQNLAQNTGIRHWPHFLPPFLAPNVCAFLPIILEVQSLTD